MVMSNPTQLRIILPESVKDSVDAVFDRQGVSMTTGLIRLMSWFAALPQDIQATILGQVSRESAELIAARAIREAQGNGIAASTIIEIEGPKASRPRR